MLEGRWLMVGGGESVAMMMMGMMREGEKGFADFAGSTPDLG